MSHSISSKPILGAQIFHLFFFLFLPLKVNEKQRKMLQSNRWPSGLENGPEFIIT